MMDNNDRFLFDDEKQQTFMDEPLGPASMKQVLEVFGHESNETPVQIDETIERYIREIKMLDKEMKVINERKQWIKDQIAVKMMRSAYLVGQDGSVLVTWKTYENEKFNQKRFAQEHPELLDKYVEYRPVRKMIIK